MADAVAIFNEPFVMRRHKSPRMKVEFFDERWMRFLITDAPLRISYE